jgi:hypothetical protein
VLGVMDGHDRDNQLTEGTRPRGRPLEEKRGKVGLGGLDPPAGGRIGGD